MTSSRRPSRKRPPKTNPVLAGVAARMAEVIELIRAGRWHAPHPGDDPLDNPGPDEEDDGGLAASGVRKVPPDKSGSGSAALVEPDDESAAPSPMRGFRRRARFTIACTLVSLALMACGTSPSSAPAATSSAPPLRHYQGDELAFDYPAGWSDAKFAVMSSFSTVLVYLSTAPLSDPCDRTPNSIACIRNAVSALGQDGVLVEWSRQSFPGWRFDPTKGRLAMIAGKAATFEEVALTQGGCQAIGGERELVVTIDDVTPDMNWTEMRACLRGPSLDGLQAQVEEMLATVAWKQ